jgi:hypothetical protein
MITSILLASLFFPQVPIDYCAVRHCEPAPWGDAECESADGLTTCCLGDQCWTTEPLQFCCSWTGGCWPTTLLGDCDPDDYIVICDWGQTNLDGTITCYD